MDLKVDDICARGCVIAQFINASNPSAPFLGGRRSQRVPEFLGFQPVDVVGWQGVRQGPKSKNSKTRGSLGVFGFWSLRHPSTLLCYSGLEIQKLQNLIRFGVFGF